MSHLLCVVFILLGTIGGVLIKKRKEAVKLSAAEKASSAYSIAQSNLKKAKNYLDKADPASFYLELSLATTGYIMKKFNIRNTDADHENMIEYLKENKVPEHLLTIYSGILKTCELAKFANRYGNMEEDYQAALKLIEEI